MDDRTSEFLRTVAEVCVAASLGRLPVEVGTRHGARITGTPAMPNPGSGREQVDDTGYAKTLLIDDYVVELEDIVECTIRLTGGDASPVTPSRSEHL